jgi:hypothetical protein
MQLRVEKIASEDRLTEVYTPDAELHDLLNMIGIYLSAQTESITLQSTLTRKVLDPTEEVPKAQQVAQNEARKTTVNEPQYERRVYGGPPQKVVTHKPKREVLLNPYVDSGRISYVDPDDDLGYGEPGTEWRAD